MSLSELSKHILTKIFGKPNSNCGVGEKERGRMVFNIKKAICDWFNKPPFEVSISYDNKQEDKPNIDLPAQLLINALKDVDKWSICSDQYGIFNKITEDIVGFKTGYCGETYLDTFPGECWMTYDEREAILQVAQRTYNRLKSRQKMLANEKSKKEMYEKYGEYLVKDV